MPVFTGITETKGAFHVSQHEASTPEQALALHVGKMPYDDGDEGDEQVDWLSRVADGQQPITLIELRPACSRVWMWLEGAQRTPQLSTYVVQTDTR